MQVAESCAGCLDIGVQDHVAHDVAGRVGVGGEQVVDYVERIERKSLTLSSANDVRMPSVSRSRSRTRSPAPSSDSSSPGTALITCWL